MAEAKTTQELLTQAILEGLEGPSKKQKTATVDSSFSAGAVSKIQQTNSRSITANFSEIAKGINDDEDLLTTISEASQELRHKCNLLLPKVDSAVESTIKRKNTRKAKDVKTAYRSVVHALEDLEDAIDLLKHFIK